MYKKNIVMISLDCVRWDMLGCYGNADIRTPHIDRIASGGIRFTQAICQAPYTPASHASIFTGLNPYLHGIRRMVGQKLSPKAIHLAEILGCAGFRTAAFVGARALGGLYGLNRGFEIFDEDLDTGLPIDRNGVWGPMRSCMAVTERALSWLRKYWGEPFFLFLHYFDAHQRAGLPFNKDTVARQIERIDHNIGRLVDFLKECELYEKTCILITSDHGDAYGEHGEWGHRMSLFDHAIRVPLILRVPGSFENTVVTKQVRSIDIAPTLTHLTNIQVEFDNKYTFEGEAVLDICFGKATVNLWAYSETAMEESVLDFEKLQTRLFSIRLPEWKLVYNQLEDSVCLFDLVHDQNETRDVHLEQPEVTRELGEILFRLLSDTSLPAPLSEMTIDEKNKLKHALKGLGYIE